MSAAEAPDKAPQRSPELGNLGTRMAHVPRALMFARSHHETSTALLDVFDRLGVQRPLLVLGRSSPALIGRSLVIDCSSRIECAVAHVAAASLSEAVRVVEAVRARPHDAVIGCGGGRTLDAAKYAAFRAAVPFISVPTQATHDGICSPVAVLADDETGRADSHGAVAPAALVVPLHVVARAPRRTLATGMADLAANLVAVEDWAWAAELTDEPFDDYAALLSRTAAQLVVSRRHAFRPDADFLLEDVEALVHGLVLSGLAMTLAGSSRPCSGPEHLVSHAFDALGLGHASHGEQVAVGCALTAGLYEQDLDPVLELLQSIGAPTRPSQIGIDDESALRALEIVPSVRPDRRSRLSTAMLVDPAFVHEAARAAWFTDPEPADGRRVAEELT